MFESAEKRSYHYLGNERLTRDWTSAHGDADTYDRNDNGLSDTETGAFRQQSFGAANRLVTSYTYKPNKNRTVVQEPAATYTFAHSAYG